MIAALLALATAFAAPAAEFRVVPLSPGEAVELLVLPNSAVATEFYGAALIRAMHQNGVGDLVGSMSPLDLMDPTDPRTAVFRKMLEDVRKQLAEAERAKALLGLIVSGQREGKGVGRACEDFWAVVKPGRETYRAVGERLSAMKAKGRSPVLEAIRLAWKQLDATVAAKRRIMLFMLCGADCDTDFHGLLDEARRLRKPTPIDVISYDIRKAQVERFEALMRISGGGRLQVLPGAGTCPDDPKAEGDLRGPRPPAPRPSEPPLFIPSYDPRDYPQVHSDPEPEAQPSAAPPARPPRRPIRYLPDPGDPANENSGVYSSPPSPKPHSGGTDAGAAH